jgi:hypothetical protein
MLPHSNKQTKEMHTGAMKANLEVRKNRKIEEKSTKIYEKQ